MTDNDRDWKPRLNIEITEVQLEKLQRYLPWGIRGKVFQVIIDDLLLMIEKGGGMVIGAILEKKLKLNDIVKLEKEKE